MRLRTLAAFICLCSSSAIHAGCSRSATRIDAIAGIVDAFKSHHIVALGEGLHGNNQAHAFRLALIRDPRFAAVVNDLVVEFGNAKYQAVLDRFTAGGDVPYTELRKVWQNTTNPTPIWDTPIYEEFFRTVRDANTSLPAERKLRVLLGEPPIDWDTVRTGADVGPWHARRTSHAAEVIRSEVLAKKRRAVVIYGDAHFRRYSKFVGNPGAPAVPTLVNLIERLGTRAFSIWTNTTVQLELMQPNIASWPVPSLTLVRGTKLGALGFYYFAGMETDPPTRMEEQFDAVLYLGPIASITMSQFPRSLCLDEDYVNMRMTRMSLGPEGSDGPGVALFRKECGPLLLGSKVR